MKVAALIAIAIGVFLVAATFPDITMIIRGWHPDYLRMASAGADEMMFGLGWALIVGGSIALIAFRAR